MHQETAITKTKGPCVILAGAGTGKTYTLVEKIKYLIKNNIYEPERILCLTFSNEAANSLRARVMSAINQIAQTTLRNIVGRFQLDEILSERDTINAEIRKVLDTHTEQWGVVVSVVEIKDIELPENMQRAMAKQAEAEREKRAKIIAAEGEFMAAQKLSEAADVIAANPIALQLRNLQTMAEIRIEKNSTIIFPAQFMSTVHEINKFMELENKK